MSQSASGSAGFSSGKFVISLDFELYWGVRDVQTLEQYRDNLLGVRQVIPGLLKIFREFDIKATWATVGFLFFDNKKDLLAHLPEVKPQYTDKNLNPYEHLHEVGENETSDPFYFGLSLVKQILAHPEQEMATHTYCHYYCLERGQTAKSFRADLQAHIRIAKQYGVTLKSLVFPRNQFNREYLNICHELGITSYRGNEQHWIYKERSEEEQKQYKRAARLADAYLNLSGHHCADKAEVMAGGMPYNIPASRFLRPYSPKLKPLDGLRLQRIKAAMTHAARKNRIFHLWWHPHNFGVFLPENLAFLRQILEHYQHLQRTFGMESITMAALSESLTTSSHGS